MRRPAHRERRGKTGVSNAARSHDVALTANTFRATGKVSFSAAKAAAEIDFLTHELARAVGLRDHDRRAASDAERARVSVTKAIKRASAKIAKQTQALETISRERSEPGPSAATPGLPELPVWVEQGVGQRKLR
jgi:hypothetical protein